MSQSQSKSTVDLEDLFDRLSRSRFRSSFRLGKSEQRYLRERRLPLVLEHARRFVKQRLSASLPQNDGKQTPMRGHPVFVAQHATATCCRSCLNKWHGIRKGTKLATDEIDYIVAVIEHWLHQQDGLSDGNQDDNKQCRVGFQQQSLFDEFDESD